jgi:hypothetical protein
LIKNPEAAAVMTTMRLCERFHFTPDELEEIDYQTVQDWLLIMKYEADMQPRVG